MRFLCQKLKKYIYNLNKKIIGGGEEAGYLEMFCCADNFKGHSKITFN